MNNDSNHQADAAGLKESLNVIDLKLFYLLFFTCRTFVCESMKHAQPYHLLKSQNILKALEKQNMFSMQRS